MSELKIQKDVPLLRQDGKPMVREYSGFLKTSASAHLTNCELIKRAEEAMEFLRTCGSDHGQRQADNIAILCKRIKLYESKLVQFNMSSREMLEDAGINK